MTMETILIAPNSTPCDSDNTDKKASHTTNSKQKHTMPIHIGIDKSMAFQRPSSVSLTVTAARFKATCPTVSRVTLSIQMKMAREVKIKY